MAVERTGSFYNHQNNTASGSISVEVPSNADICIVAVAVYDDDLAYTDWLDELNFDDGSGLDFTLVDSAFYLENRINFQTFYMTSDDPNWPGAGNKTIYWASPNAPTEGHNIGVLFYKNVDKSDPIVDYETIEEPSDTHTTSFTGVGENDMGVILTYSWNEAPDMDFNDQTVIHSSLYNSAGLGVAEKLGEDALYWESRDIMGVPIVLGAASGSAVPVLMNSYRQRRT